MSVFTRCDFWSFIVSCRLMCPPQSVVFIVLACFHVLRYIIQQSPTNEPYIRVSTSLPNRPAIHSSKSYLLSPFAFPYASSSILYVHAFIYISPRPSWKDIKWCPFTILDYILFLLLWPTSSSSVNFPTDRRGYRHLRHSVQEISNNMQNKVRNARCYPLFIIILHISHRIDTTCPSASQHLHTFVSFLSLQ